MGNRIWIARLRLVYKQKIEVKPMNRTVVITEGDADAAVLKKILPKRSDNDVKIVSGGGRYAAASMARSILVAREETVAFVMEAETDSERLIAEQRSSFNELLGQVAPEARFKVFMVVPDFETILNGKHSNGNHLKKTKRIGKAELEHARAQPIIAELAAFLESAQGVGTN
jgi:hypothetical protein